MLQMMIRLYLVFAVLIVNVRCKSAKRLIVSRGEPFTFDCQIEESVYFARRLDHWTEVSEGSEMYLSLNLNFDYLSQKKHLRVNVDSAQPENVGYYGCRKASWSSTEMNRVYQLVLSDVESFYWTYVCHGPAGSCVRTDDSLDETRSTFEVAEQTPADLYCCAAVTGYNDIDLKMSSIGDRRGTVSMNRKTELDGSLVICAHQHTTFRRRQETLTCELMIDNRSHSTLSSDVFSKEAMPVDPDADAPYEYTPPPRGGSDENGDPYFRPRGPSSRGKLSTGKRIAIILGSIFAGLVLVGLLFGVIFCLCCKKKALADSSKKGPGKYSSVRTQDKSTVVKSKEQEESIYVEPTPLYQNTAVTFRL